MSDTQTPNRETGQETLEPAPRSLQSAVRGEIANAGGFMPAEWAGNALQLDLKQFFRHKRMVFLRRIGMFVLFPTFLAALYAYVYATPRFVSEFQIVYRSNAPSIPGQAAGGGGVSGLLAGVLGSSAEVDMTRVLSSYLTSKTVMESVDRKLELRKTFSDQHIDWPDRLSADAKSETFQKYFQKRVTVYEENGGFLTVDAEGFTPEAAQRLAQALASEADEMVSSMGNRAHNDMVRFTESEMKHAEVSLTQATQELTAFRDNHSDYDFARSAVQLSGVVGGLNTQLAEANAQLSSAKNFLGDTAPTVMVLNSRIKALQAQIKAEQDRLATNQAANADQGHAGPTSEGSPYSKILAQYASLVQSEDFARQLYLTSKQANEAARLEAARKDAYVVSFVPPNLPEQATAPDGVHAVVTTLLASLIVYSVGSLLLGLVRDQAGI